MTGTGAAPLFRRDELLGGLPARRAGSLLFAIEARTARLVDRSRSALATHRTDHSQQEREAAFLEALAGARELPVRVTVQDLERHAPSWAELVPQDAVVRAELLGRIGDKYGLVAGRIPRISAALGLPDAQVSATYERARGHAVEADLRAPADLREHFAWRRAALAERLETLPPFWMAFALALTETVAEGILAIPVAVAGIGPAAGIALLILLGVVNVVTLAALVEAITRTGSMRYGETYFGQLVRGYLGAPSAAVFSAMLFVFNAVVLLVYLLGFASVMSDASGLASGWWVALLVVVNAYFLRRGDLDATVASALVIGAVNIGLILTICAIGLVHLDPANLSQLGGAAAGIGVLQIVFGVILVAYFGHTSAGNAAKLLLREDMTGRALLGGNIAGMVTVIVLYCLCVLAINGAVGSEALLGFEGTAISPLADVVGDSVLVLGAVYVVLALGIGSVYCSLGMSNQVREWLPRVSRGARPAGSRWQQALAGPRERTAVSMLPLLLVFAVLEIAIVLGVDDFSGPLGVIGILAVPLLGGVFPMLLVAAARTRGEFLPQPVLRPVGHPAAVIIVSSLFVLAIALHGLWIWTDAWARVAAIAVALGITVLAVRAWRSGSFRARDVLQLRVEGPGSGRATIEAVAAGKALPVAVGWSLDGAPRFETGSTVALGSVARLGEVRVVLDDRAARPLQVWAHRVDAEGRSAAWSGRVRLEGRQSRELLLDSLGRTDTGDGPLEGLRFIPAGGDAAP